jgi:hypothetical protein
MTCACLYTAPCIHLSMPCTVCTPEPCTMHHTYLPYTPTPLLSLHRSLPCLPHSKLACTHDLHMHTHIDMPLSIDTFPCHALYTPLRPAPHTYVPPSHLYPVLCPHRSLSCLPHSITACTHDHHISTHIGMPLPIDAFPCHALYAPLSLHHAQIHACLHPFTPSYAHTGPCHTRR